MSQKQKECQNILQILRTRTIIYCIQSNAEIQSEKNNDKAFEPKGIWQDQSGTGCTAQTRRWLSRCAHDHADGRHF